MKQLNKLLIITVSVFFLFSQQAFSADGCSKRIKRLEKIIKKQKNQIELLKLKQEKQVQGLRYNPELYDKNKLPNYEEFEIHYP